MAKCNDCINREMEELKRVMEQESCDGCGGKIEDWRQKVDKPKPITMPIEYLNGLDWPSPLLRIEQVAADSGHTLPPRLVGVSHS